jgi:hypothetical protein
MGEAMNARMRFAALEIACREQARTAQNEATYWLCEADEWARLKEKTAETMIESPPLQLELLQRDYR